MEAFIDEMAEYSNYKRKILEQLYTTHGAEDDSKLFKLMIGKVKGANDNTIRRYIRDYLLLKCWACKKYYYDDDVVLLNYDPPRPDKRECGGCCEIRWRSGL